MSEKVRAHLVISGRVQGVCFRAETVEQAEALGVTGWVRNTDDGHVEVLCDGERDKVERLIQWCRRGPTLARVLKVDLEWESYRGNIPDFRITR